MFEGQRSRFSEKRGGSSHDEEELTDKIDDQMKILEDADSMICEKHRRENEFDEAEQLKNIYVCSATSDSHQSALVSDTASVR